MSNQRSDTPMSDATDKQLEQASRETVIREAKKRRLTLSGESRSSSRVQDILDALVEIIEASGLQAGDRLPSETELAQSLGVGRSTIREALMAWQRMGIVVRNKGAGTRLSADISQRSMNFPLTVKVEAAGLMRTHQVRMPLEIEATRLACQNATDKDKRIINARCEELMAIFEAGENWHAADKRFHAAIHDASGNPLFGQLILQLHEAFEETYEAPFDQPQMADSSIPLHRNLADAVINQDADQAEAILRKILSIVEDEVAIRLNE
ncbi:FadR/GntR family transcriptional regulator [Cohaesibacter intestini]|uniref:FadR/GntR family transcriptional regulator n=1 Tax=Cohaesibacter intestini TaxID=2211145 RepID=UPI0018E5604A|nr:FadR/GntR family transcriptional regulator [Cohaesibacter intestini]